MFIGSDRSDRIAENSTADTMSNTGHHCRSTCVQLRLKLGLGVVSEVSDESEIVSIITPENPLPRSLVELVLEVPINRKLIIKIGKKNVKISVNNAIF